MHKRLLLLASLTLASTARADVPPPNMDGCRGKQAGAKCTTDSQGDGTCKQERCSRLDYSNGIPPGSVEYDCLLCAASEPGAATPPAAEPDAAPVPEAKGSSCTTVPGASLGLTVLVAGWLARRRNRSA